MHHSFFDRYSDGNSIIHRLDPRVKIITLLLYVLAVALTSTANILQLPALAVLLAAVIAASAVPWGYVLRRSLTVVPFVLVICLFAYYFVRQPLLWLGTVTAKACLAAMAMVVLSSTTRFPDLLRGLKGCGIPSIFILLLSFMYRYIYLFSDEAMRMERARQSRSCGSRSAGRLKVFSHMVGTLFLRAYERGERIYAGMLARGFDGELRSACPLHCSRNDIVFSGIFIAGIILIKVW